MHGFGPRVLQVLPKEGVGATVKDIQARIGDIQIRSPSGKTVREHLQRLEQLGLVYKEPARVHGDPARYFRLVDSVFDAGPLDFRLASELEV